VISNSGESRYIKKSTNQNNRRKVTKMGGGNSKRQNLREIQETSQMSPQMFKKGVLLRTALMRGNRDRRICYGVATISRMLKNTGLFAEYRSLL